MNHSEMIKKGATHYHPGNSDWRPGYIKVTGPDDNQLIETWLDWHKGSWSDIPIYDEDPENYIKL